MVFSTKKVQQRTRRQRQVAAAAAARCSFAAAHPSILRNARHDRNNIRNVSFSATCTAKFFVEELPSVDVSCPSRVRVEREERMLPHVEEAAQPEEEEECVRIVMTLVIMSQLNRLRGAQGAGHQGGVR